MCQDRNVFSIRGRGYLKVGLKFHNKPNYYRTNIKEVVDIYNVEHYDDVGVRKERFSK